MIPRYDPEWADVWRREGRLHATSSDENVRASSQIGGEVDDGSSMRGSLCRLQPGDFQSKVGQSGCALALELLVRWRILRKQFPGHRQPLAKHQIRR